MGVAYFIVLDNEEPGFETFVNGKAIARARDEINTITSKLGLKAIDELTSFGDLDDEFDVPEELCETETPWFDAAEGTKWAAAIRRHVEAHRKAVAEPDEVIGELEEYERLFKKAAKIKARWHFQMDI